MRVTLAILLLSIYYVYILTQIIVLSHKFMSILFINDWGWYPGTININEYVRTFRH